MNDDVIICQCADVDHCCIITYNTEDKEVYINIHLRKLPFLSRLKYGIKYIFGKGSKFGDGAFDEIIVSQKDWKKFKKIAYVLKPLSKNQNKPVRMSQIKEAMMMNKKLDRDIHLD